MYLSTSNSVVYDLPKYSPVTETPKYTAEPSPDERRLQITRRVRREESGVYVEKTKHMTIALTNQAPDCKVPTYSRAAEVQGAITFTKHENIVQVETKLCGNINISMASAVISGERDIVVCDETEVLYRKDCNENDGKRKSLFSRNSASSTPTIQSFTSPKFTGEQCPATLVFTSQFPLTYQHDGTTRTLPPSYSAQFGTIPGISFAITYVLKIITVRKTPLGDKRSTTSLFLEYIPRSRPPQPSLPSSMTFLSTLKLSPEEWELHENKAQLKQGVPETSPQFYFVLAIPKTRIFPLTQTIPFHLQILSSSQELLAPFELIGAPRSIASKNDSNLRDHEAEVPMFFGHTPLLQGIANASRIKARINVSLERNVATETHGDWFTIKQTLTTQQLVLSSNATPQDENSGMKCLAWDGQLQFKEEYHCGAFFGPGFRIRDLLVLTVYPAEPESSPLRPVFYSIPIRVVTDPYTDEIIPGMEIIRSAPPMTDRS
ncbi:hypothetical protein Clacol_005663 [Clathrus columnatus]|uniref:Arrestin-like N-terminal domain-containing protein n=1 Tax=Clathrus columnatus TaxID=1419009 RepID=A0AAV5AAR4_9AGAM|nr:hypothetical protein Clacol_005663 [Clathrus columnatus]